MSKTGGTTGTNQYRVKGMAQRRPAYVIPPLSTDPAVDQSVSPDEADEHQLAQFGLAMATAMREAAAENKVIGGSTFLALSDCPPQIIRCLVVPGSPQEPPTPAWVLATAVNHPNCPADVLVYARSRQSELKIQLALLQRENAPVIRWRRLLSGRKADEYLDIGIAPKCPDQIKRQIWRSLVVSTYDYAYLSRVNITPGIADLPQEILNNAPEQPRPGLPLLEALAKNPTCPPDILTQLVAQKDIIKIAVLANPNCPEHLKAITILGR